MDDDSTPSTLQSWNGHINPAFEIQPELYDEIELNPETKGTDPESGRNPFIPPFPSCDPSSEETLIYTRIEKIQPRDFSRDVRGSLDVKHYFHDIKVLLDVDASKTEEIVDLLLQKVSLCEVDSIITFWNR